jgi:hypothetical protein
MDIDNLSIKDYFEEQTDIPEWFGRLLLETKAMYHSSNFNLAGNELRYWNGLSKYSHNPERLVWAMKEAVIASPDRFPWLSEIQGFCSTRSGGYAERYNQGSEKKPDDEEHYYPPHLAKRAFAIVQDVLSGKMTLEEGLAEQEKIRQEHWAAKDGAHHEPKQIEYEDEIPF